MKSRYKSLYCPFLLRDMCVSRECSVQRVSKLIRLKETALTRTAQLFLR